LDKLVVFMPGTAIPPVFFASYARADTDHEPYHRDMKRFIDDLSARVAAKMGVSRSGICFFDESSIETGAVWRSELADALKTSQDGVTLYSPSYFTSPWCGKEFQVFLNRATSDPAAPRNQVGIVPVLWMKCTTLPPSVREIQYKHDAFPREYTEVGVQPEDLWEFAARGEAGLTYPWGDAFDVAKCNSAEHEIGGTSEVTRFESGTSPFGCSDMAGNLWEFVSVADSGADWCVLRGGSYKNTSSEVRSYLRSFVYPIGVVRPISAFGYYRWN
jgi:hypothetical protein